MRWKRSSSLSPTFISPHNIYRIMSIFFPPQKLIRKCFPGRNFPKIWARKIYDNNVGDFLLLRFFRKVWIFILYLSPLIVDNRYRPMSVHTYMLLWSRISIYEYIRIPKRVYKFEFESSRFLSWSYLWIPVSIPLRYTLVTPDEIMRFMNEKQIKLIEYLKTYKGNICSLGPKELKYFFYIICIGNYSPYT